MQVESIPSPEEKPSTRVRIPVPSGWSGASWVTWRSSETLRQSTWESRLKVTPEMSEEGSDSFVRRNALFVAAMAFTVVLVGLSLIGPYLPGVPR